MLPKIFLWKHFLFPPDLLPGGGTPNPPWVPPRAEKTCPRDASPPPAGDEAYPPFLSTPGCLRCYFRSQGSGQPVSTPPPPSVDVDHRSGALPGALEGLTARPLASIAHPPVAGGWGATPNSSTSALRFRSSFKCIIGDDINAPPRPPPPPNDRGWVGSAALPTLWMDALSARGSYGPDGDGAETP